MNDQLKETLDFEHSQLQKSKGSQMARVSCEAPSGKIGPGMDFNKAKTKELLDQYRCT